MVSYYRASWQWGSSIDFWDVGPQMLPVGEHTPEEWQRVHQEAKKRGSIELDCDYINGAMFSPNGSMIGVSYHYPALYSFPAKKLLWTFGPNGQLIESSNLRGRIDYARLWTKPVFTPDSRSMLCGSPDGVIFRWDVKSGRMLDKTQAHKGRVLDISLSSGGKTLASCGADDLLKTWTI
ncbi:MAG: hypothetical protein EOO38_06160 [Cytophagaceae bacterium]|nr:MAG: hypothetical protein EOO38_06160 [Cytophagaceae bacterium]